MSKLQSKDQLYELIRSLDKAEKRNFKLYATRTGGKDMKFVQLFDLMDKADMPEDPALLLQISDLNASKLANLKRHLYTQILKSLRLIYSEKEIDIQIREQLDYAKILYTKGFYLESLRILEKLKTLLRGSNQDILLLETVEFQKMIELRHITRSRQVVNKMESLIEESIQINRKVANLSRLATLNINIQGMYITAGHVRSARDRFFLKEYFYSNLDVPDYNIKKISFFEQVLVFQSFVWYHYMNLDFAFCYKNAKKWVDLFHRKNHMIELDPGLYLRGLHYTLTSLFYLNHRTKFHQYYDHLKNFAQSHEKQLSISTELLFFQYLTNAEMNKNYIDGDLEATVALENKIEESIIRLSGKLDTHRYHIFLYKIGWAYLILGQYKEALARFAKILQHTDVKLREDTVCYSRLLSLLCDFKLGDYDYVFQQVSNLRKYLATHGELNEANSHLLSYIAYCSKQSLPFDRERLEVLCEKMQIIRTDPYERRAYIYFNYEDWAVGERDQIGTRQALLNRIAAYENRKRE